MTRFEYSKENNKRVLEETSRQRVSGEEGLGTDLDVHVARIEDKHPATLTHLSELDNVTERFHHWYERLYGAVFSLESKDGFLDLQAFESGLETAFAEVCADIDSIYGQERKEENIRVKKDVFQAFVREMNDIYNRDNDNIRAGLAKNYGEKLLKQYISEEYIYVDDRERKTKARAMSERAKEVVEDFLVMVKDVPEGLKVGKLGISETELDARVKGFLNETMLQESKEIVHEVLLSMKRMLESMDEKEDLDGRWRLVAMAIDTWCDVYFPDMHFIKDKSDNNEEDEW